MSEKPPIVARFCPACGAQSSLDAARCWLCRAELPAGGAAAAPQPARSPPVSPLSFTLTTLLVVITLAAVVFGVAREAPGVAVMLVIVCLPALVVTAVRSGLRKVRGEAMTWSEKLATFVASAATVAAALVGLAVAAAVAFFVWCFTVLAAGGGI